MSKTKTKTKTIHQLARTGHWKPLLKAITDNPHELNAIDERGATPMHYAISGNKVSAVEVLSTFNAEVPKTYPNGNCVLSSAVKAGHVQMLFWIAPHLKSEIRNAREHLNSWEAMDVLNQVEHGKKRAGELLKKFAKNPTLFVG